MNVFSDWFKVDLHIHTDYSRKTKTNDYQGVFDIAVLKQKLKDNDVRLFSMTDHNIINNEAYRWYYENYEEGDPKLLIGCEFDIDVPESSKADTYHSLIIFDCDSSEEVDNISGKIETLFLKKEPDYTKRKINIDELYELFNDYNYFFIPHAGNTKSILYPYKDDIKHCQQMVLLMPSAFEKVKESVRQKYNEGFDRLKTLDFQYKLDVPYIDFSDNHNCNKYPCTNKNSHDHEFYCIKGQPTFESIRFAFIDPQSRIKKYSDVEVLKRFDNSIHSIKIKETEMLEESTLYFSPNLNVIIGGRSSGKSLLFNLLGKKINNNKHIFNKYSNSIDSSETEIKSFIGTEYKTSITYNQQDVIYINQGDIVNYFENNSLKDLLKESGKNDEYTSVLSAFKDEKNDLDKLIYKLVQLYSELCDSIKADFVIHNKDMDSIFDDSYYFKLVAQLEDKKSSFDNATNIITSLLDNIEKFTSNKNWNLDSTELDIVEAFKGLVKSKEEYFSTNKTTHTKQTIFIEEINRIIKSKNSTLDLKGKEKEASNSRITTFKENAIKLFDTMIRVEEHCLILEEYNYNFKRKIDIDENVSVIIEIENKESLKSKIIEGLSNPSQTDSLYQVLIGLALGNIKIKNYADSSVENFRKKINTQLNGILGYFESPIEYLQYSESSTSKNNSPGYNSEKYLETILKKGNSKIIFIDQPEDNLGNKFIAENLIDLIRDLKFKKQIFLVTHNPSIVVYGDAESIILCSNETKKIKYQQLVLENKDDQKEICTVLDGGYYIFEQRAKKYDIKKIQH